MPGVGVGSVDTACRYQEGSGPTPPTDNWILATGEWNDSGVWVDSDEWID
jgi:hypothetical protein